MKRGTILTALILLAFVGVFIWAFGWKVFLVIAGASLAIMGVAYVIEKV